MEQVSQLELEFWQELAFRLEPEFQLVLVFRLVLESQSELVFLQVVLSQEQLFQLGEVFQLQEQEFPWLRLAWAFRHGRDRHDLHR
ncbi:MAG TPA: hypothetical protein DIW81_25175, partial [Planctomycetaceae bacterium]|nr:hypothetical protein [Planctomycetaceae bacterium]